MVPGLLERERLGAEMRRQEMLRLAARERRVDDALAGRARAAVPGWRSSLGGLLVRVGGRLAGSGRATGPAPVPAAEGAAAAR